jgi:hypothetical protein
MAGSPEFWLDPGRGVVRPPPNGPAWWWSIHPQGPKSILIFFFLSRYIYIYILFLLLFFLYSDTWHVVSFWIEKLTEALICRFSKIEVLYVMQIET